MSINKVESSKEINNDILYSLKSIINPILIVTKKTFIYNICTIKRLIIAIILMVFVPIIWLLVVPTDSYPINATLTETLGLVLFFYTYGIIFPLLIGTAASPLISEELKSGTLIMLVSKPISRSGIVLGKLIALILFGIIVSLISLFIIILVGIARHPFLDLGKFFILNFIYSLFIIFCFGGLSLGFSSIFKKPRNVTLIPVILIVFSFLIGIIIKSFLTIGLPTGSGASLYEQFQIYHFDISYHMGNIYKLLVDSYVPGASQQWGMFLILFGVTKYDPTPLCDSNGYCSTLPYMGFTIDSNYYLPFISAILLVLLGIVALIGGTLYLNRRDISG